MANGNKLYVMTEGEKKYFWTAVVIFAALVLLSVIFDSIKGPDLWLTEWTAYAATYAALAVAVHKVWKLSDAVVERILRK